ncbi:MAG: hypothetical protein M1838_000620 [Thelocarpon superellum]|nr:MAG: hypothetical protein M1838_000620 [Thelocarpon superellum]
MTQKLPRSADAADVQPVMRTNSVVSQLPAYSPADNAATAGAPPVYPSAEEEKSQLQESLNHAASPAAANHSVDREPQLESTFFIPTRDAPGHATATTLNRGLQVPTYNRLVTSGFPYPDRLAQHNVTPEDWARFTSEITTAAQLKPGDWALSIGGGTGTLLVSGLIIGWFGLIPAYLMGRHIHRRLEERNLTAARSTGSLEAQLLKWNQEFFAPRSLLIRLDLPGEGADLPEMDIETKKWGRGGRCAGGGWKKDPAQWMAEKEREKGERWSEQKRARFEEKRARCEAWAQRKQDKRAAKMAWSEEKQKLKALRKGRIVIIPMGSKGPVDLSRGAVDNAGTNAATAASPVAADPEKDLYSA